VAKPVEHESDRAGSENGPKQADRTQDFLRLYAAHERSLHAYILALVADWAATEEVSQETVMRLWQQFDQYDPTKDFGRWARTVAYYQVLTHRKSSSRSRMQFSGAFLDAVVEQTESTDSLAEQSRRDALAGCLGKLTQAKRDLLRRCYAGEESVREVATRLGRTFDATRKELLRIRTALASCIERTLRREGSP
jgi:RNA polymerase sigma-70 factor (ECF subfamily)